MAQLFDARGNELTASILDQIGGGTITDARVSSAALTAVNSELLMDLNGKAVACFQINLGGATTGTLVFEGTTDGVNYLQLPAWEIATESMLSSVVLGGGAAVRIFQVGCTGFRRVRVRVSVVIAVSTCTAFARATTADFAIYARPQPSLINVSIAPALATGGTITLTGVAGLFHYITNLSYSVAGSGALQTVGAAVFITTTNLPGTPAWALDVPATAAGASRLVNNVVDWSAPLKSSVAGTNTTFVFPVPGNQSTLRANVSYYLGA